MSRSMTANKHDNHNEPDNEFAEYLLDIDNLVSQSNISSESFKFDIGQRQTYRCNDVRLTQVALSYNNANHAP